MDIWLNLFSGAVFFFLFLFIYLFFISRRCRRSGGGAGRVSSSFLTDLLSYVCLFCLAIYFMIDAWILPFYILYLVPLDLDIVLIEARAGEEIY